MTFSKLKQLTYNLGDVHFPYLTVLNTLGFAVETKTPGSGMKQDQRHGKVRDLRDSLLKVFGMEETRSTLVGNEFVAGVSGGERKRVSLAEVVSILKPAPGGAAIRCATALSECATL